MLPRRRRARALTATTLRLPSRVGPRQPDSPAASATISDHDLHAFVDGALDAVRRERVRAFLDRNPTVAADVAAYRRQNLLLREFKHEGAPNSPALNYVTVQLARRLGLVRGARALACSAVTVAVVAAVWLAVSGDWAAVPHVVLTAGR